jgi:hypothetical protein
VSKHGSGDVAFLLVDGYSILGTQTEFTAKKEAITEETTVLGDTAVGHTAVGLSKGEFSQKGYFDDTALSSNAALVSKQGTSRVMCYGLEGNVAGAAFTGWRGAMQADFERVISRGGLHKANASYVVSGAIDEGVILHLLTTESGAGNTRTGYIDSSASSANGAEGYLQVRDLSLGGYTNVVVLIEHSTDHSSWVTLITFTAVTAAPAAEAKAVAGTVNRYLATSWSFTGAGSGPTVGFMAGLARL